jgi:hypothetical protein
VSRVLAYYQPVLRRVYRDDYPKRERDLEHFATIAERYRATGRCSPTWRSSRRPTASAASSRPTARTRAW